MKKGLKRAKADPTSISQIPRHTRTSESQVGRLYLDGRSISTIWQPALVDVITPAQAEEHSVSTEIGIVPSVAHGQNEG